MRFAISLPSTSGTSVIPLGDADMFVQKDCISLDEREFFDYLKYDFERVGALALFDAPYVTLRRVNLLLPSIEAARKRGVTMCAQICPLEENAPEYKRQSYEEGTNLLQTAGAHLNVGIDRHQKFCTFDDSVIYHGSLNPLSQNRTSEYMEREINPEKIKYVIEKYKLDNCTECIKSEPWAIKTGSISDELRYAGAAMAAQRKRIGLTQRQLADILKISPATLCRIERGSMNISFELVARIGEYLGLRWRPIPWYQLPTMGRASANDFRSKAETQPLLFGPDV
jgi:DNA-binding XRE family transcriptional regulator